MFITNIDDVVKCFFECSLSTSFRLDDGSELDHLVSHIHHRLGPVRVDDAELARGRVVKERDILVLNRSLFILSDRPAKRSILGADRGGKVLERVRAAHENKASVGSSWVFNAKQVCLAHITHINTAHVLGADLGHGTLHEALHPASRSELFLPQGRAHDEARADSHQLELLVIRKGSLEVPGGLFGENFALRVGRHAARSVRVAPVTFIESTVGRFVFRSHDHD